MINCEKYILPTKNYIEVESIKNYIVLGNTNNKDMKHYDGWLHRHNGNYKKTASFTIDLSGSIYQHFDPKYQSNYFENIELDKQSIIILLENEGWLTRKNSSELFYNWKDDIYKGVIFDKAWRGYGYWSNYNEKQFESAIWLVKHLCDEFVIPNTSFNHNTKIDSLIDYRGVIYKSNLEKYYTDLNPSWDCILFKNKIEV